MEQNHTYSEKGYKLWFWIRPVFRKIFRIEVEGIENVPKDKGCIVASNHRSNLDPFVLNTIFPRPIFFMAKHELFRIPVLSWIIKKAGAIPVKRNKRDISSLKKSVELLKSNHCIGIFPEGTRAKPGEFRKPQSGVGLIVSKTDAYVIPVRIEGTDKVFPVGSKLPKIWKSKITVKIGKPLNLDRKKDYREIAEEIMEEIKKL